MSRKSRRSRANHPKAIERRIKNVKEVLKWKPKDRKRMIEKMKVENG